MWGGADSFFYGNEKQFLFFSKHIEKDQQVLRVK
jgi:hypothetical protein